MSVLAWAMMGIAIWHFTVFLPDRFIGGIVGAFGAALAGSIVFGFVVNGFDLPSRAETELVQALIAVPGAALGLAVAYFVGARREAAAPPEIVD